MQQAAAGECFARAETKRSLGVDDAGTGNSARPSDGRGVGELVWWLCLRACVRDVKVLMLVSGASASRSRLPIAAVVARRLNDDFGFHPRAWRLTAATLSRSPLQQPGRARPHMLSHARRGGG